MNKLEELIDFGGVKKDISFLIISLIALVLSILKFDILSIDPAWIAIVLCGVPIILEAIIGLITRFDIKADVLVSIALIASIITNETFAAGEIAFIMQLGALLEDLTVSKAKAGIEKLVHLTPRTARKITGDSEMIINAEDVEIGDILRVLPGETIAVDGKIISGQTSINQAVMTGESLPVDKTVGDEVSSGSVNQFGSFEMIATKVGDDSSIQRMIKLVQTVNADKARIVSIADRWATWIVIIALSSALLTWIISGEIIRAVTILVVFCPCALVLATPTAIMAAIGNATKHGFLTREGDALERLAKVNAIAFDKTGTLTYGSPKVVAVESFMDNITNEELYFYTASAENSSEHPLGKAIVSCYRSKNENSKLVLPESFEMIPGKGICATVDKKIILAGSAIFLASNGITIQDEISDKAEKYLNNGCTMTYVSIDNAVAGFIALSDTLRQEAKEVIKEINDLDISPILLTGDNEKASQYIARQLGVSRVFSNCLPEDKLKHIGDYQETIGKICMVGDGINDAPALKKAFVGIAMGGVGSDIAVEAADIVLINDKLDELPHLLRLSKHMMKVIKCNLSFSMALNFIAIILAITGILNPILGALVHNAGSILVIINSAFLLNWKRK